MSVRIFPYLRRNWLQTFAAVVLVALTLNVWAQDGRKAFLVVLAATAGCLTVMGSVGWVTGAQVVKHARREAAAIESGTHPKRKELGR